MTSSSAVVIPSRHAMRGAAHDIPRQPRRGMSLVEVVVACTLLAVALVAMTGVAMKMAQRTRGVSYQAQRNAVYVQEVNRIESMYYDSLSRFLVADTVQSGPNKYAFSYVVDPESTSATGVTKYTKVNLTVTPLITLSSRDLAAAGASALTGVVRRAKPPISNPLNYP